MAGLKQISRCQEGVVTVEGVHHGQVILVLVHLISEIGKLIVHNITQLVLGKKTSLS